MVYILGYPYSKYLKKNVHSTRSYELVLYKIAVNLGLLKGPIIRRANI